MKIGITLLLSLLAGAALADDFNRPCFYQAADTDEGLATHERCASRSGETWRVAPAHLPHLAFNEDGLADLAIDGAMFYVNRQGATLKVITFDNGADYFEEGLVRGLVGGRIAYYDKHFRQVIGPRYDWGTPFENGVALVCQGCRVGPPDNDGHRALVGGLWGAIDKTGKEVVALRYSSIGDVPSAP